MDARPGSRPSPESAARIVLRPIGNPLPLGFIALAAGTLLVSGLQLSWLAAAEGQKVALILIAFVAPLQLVSCVFGLLARDVVAGTAMGVLSGTWLAIALVMLSSPPGSTSDALGLFLLLAGLAMLVPAAGAQAGKLVAFAVLSTTALRFFTTGLYHLTASGTWKDVTGVIGVLLCGLGLYAAAAMAIEDARGETVLPVLRRGAGREALEGGLREQLHRVEHEPGVREQL